MNTPPGRKRWVFPGGHIPLHGTGPEPEFTSHEKLCILNAGHDDAHLHITLFYADREAVGPYEVVVKARRVRHFRFNDLIDPLAMPLGTDYAALVESNVPVVVQFVRQDTRQEANALLSVMGYADDG